MAVHNQDRVRSSLNILKHLHNEDASIVGSQNHTWKVCRSIYSLISHFFIRIKKAVLMPCEVVLSNEFVDIQHAILWSATLCSFDSPIKQVKVVDVHR